MTEPTIEDRALLFHQWDTMKDEIKELYAEQDKQAVPLMEQAIARYEQIVSSKGKTFNKAQQVEEYVLDPLNGKERLAFIKARINSHYAYIQLEMLYIELRKKIARLEAMEKRQQMLSQQTK